MLQSVPSLAVACAIAFCGTLAACSALRAFSLGRNLLDHPNERSLHILPVPRLGGVAIAGSSSLAMLAWHVVSGTTLDKIELAWLSTSLPIAVIGLVDDLRPLRARTRLGLQFICAVSFCTAAGIPPGISFVANSMVTLPPAISLTLWSIFIVAVLNIFNFMDGMDGLAGAQALGAGLGLAGALTASPHPSFAALCGLIAASSAGFLLHNFPPAKIFMGDTGSTFLGFSFAALAVGGSILEPVVPVPTFVFALAPFLLDGSFTLLRRAIHGEAFWKAHRTHLYQRAVSSGRTHREVLLVYASLIAVGAVSAVVATVVGGKGLFVLISCAGMVFLSLIIWVQRIEGAVTAHSKPDSRIQATSSATAPAKST